jgi:prolyl oligopeptidase
MKSLFSLLFITSTLMSTAQLKYPATKKTDFSEDYHGTRVEDPYRWLEDDNSEETKSWVRDENKVTFDYLSKIPYRDEIKKRLEMLWDYPKYSSPFQKAGYYYFFKQEGLQNQAVMYRQKGIDGEPEEFLNPNTLSKEGIAALAGFNFSKNGKYIAYSIAVAGSDWQEVYVMETSTKKLLSDKIQYVKFSNYSWDKEDGFYYSGYDKPDEKSKLSGQNQFHKVFYHKLGTEQSADSLVYEDKQHPLRYHFGGLSEDGRFLVLNVTEGTSGAEIWYLDKQSKSSKLQLLIPGFATEPDFVDNHGDFLLIKTNDNAPNYKVVLIDPKNPDKSKWKTIIPEKEEALQSVSTAGGYLFAQYLKDASTKVYQYTYDGKLVREITLPGIGSATGFGGEKEDKEFFYTFSSFSTPPSIYRYNIGDGQSSLFRKTKTNMNTDDFVTDQIFYKSKDGTRVPMFLTYKRGIDLSSGKNPVLLYGYGGFNVPITPAFSISNAFFIEQGGIFVVANLRGGSEYGEKWHKAGMLEKKQNVFDDFIAAAEFLIKKRFTNPDKLAIKGGSNGGLLVGAAMTQRPELFKVALPQVGVMDMLRFHKFTVGWGWTVEYGSSDSANHFPFLYKYSPYHNLRKGVHYPATLVTTADHDDRVVPAHSFKFAARLQEYHNGSNPVLIRIDTNAGHGAGKPTSKLIEEAADTWSFLMKNLDMPFNNDPSAVKSNDGKKPAQKKAF